MLIVFYPSDFKSELLIFFISNIASPVIIDRTPGIPGSDNKKDDDGSILNLIKELLGLYLG